MIPIALIIDIVARRTGIAPSLIKGAARTYDVAAARQAAMWLARQITGASTTVIGRAFGRRDHTTVIHSLKKIERRRALDEAFAERLIQLRLAIELESDILARHGHAAMAQDEPSARAPGLGDGEPGRPGAPAPALAGSGLAYGEPGRPGAPAREVAALMWAGRRLGAAAGAWESAAFTKNEGPARKAFQRARAVFDDLCVDFLASQKKEDSHGQIKPRQNDRLPIQCPAIA
jgi:hypothetical protein